LAQLNIKLPVIVITSDDKKEIYERAINKGITAFLRKRLMVRYCLTRSMMLSVMVHVDGAQRNQGRV
jgi:CheY-like chemotaxis protein